MKWRNTGARYGVIAQLFHWLVVALVFTQFGFGIYGANLPLSFDKLVVLARHKSIGITIFALVALRLAWRGFSPPPALPEHMTSAQRALAHASHALLYALLFALPISGWLYSSATGISVSWFGIVPLPDLVATNETTAVRLLDLHIALAITLGVTITGHVAAALWHHFAKHDSVLLRMLPGPMPTENTNETDSTPARPRLRRPRTR